MPLSRSSTRNKSRSPAPPISQSSPQYFPPSHFAVAGGFCLPDRENAERNRSASFSEEHPSQDAYMPVSYLSSASSDPSSFDYNGNHTTESRPRKSSAESSRKKRESQIHNLPLVEAHLLPSLRDTIDKMTRPPSRMTTSSNTNTPTITLSRQNGSEDYSSGGGSIDISSYPPPSPRLKPPSTRTPTTENRPTTEKRAATPKTGSVLKSALKAPTPRLSSSPSPSPTPAPVLSPGGGALKSVRSLLRRKSSSSTAVSVSSASDDQTTKVRLFIYCRSHHLIMIMFFRKTNLRYLLVY
ncbi:hypothetical protein J3R30DRAFT_120033 [Lentinula aciculospora]|uniref:Uncharacterized protein n=1 Tax=Lentinula aciculospora TaxID=153920 RepID=A0A9W9AU87_9AGAR|nr:hypothetical protein J3R30DRAFT_120033 [Lentinula aciculospora]